MDLPKRLQLIFLITAYFTLLSKAMVPGYSQQTDDQIKEKYDDTAGWIGQFSSNDCSGSPVTGSEFKQTSFGNGPVEYLIAGARPAIIPNGCIPWYPLLTETEGPSVGVTFGVGANKTTAIKFFRQEGNCISDADTDTQEAQNPSCCDEAQGGYLGTMFEAVNSAHVVSDFGSSKFGMKEGKCAKIGLQPNANQTLWQMRYFMGIA